MSNTETVTVPVPPAVPWADSGVSVVSGGSGDGMVAGDEEALEGG